jgi:hypothetical protein
MYHKEISLIKMLNTIIRFSYTSGLCSSLEATDQISLTQNNANSFAGTVASLSHLTSCTPTKSHLYFTHSLAAAVNGLTYRDTLHSKSTSAASFVPKNPNTTTSLQDLGGFFGIRWFKKHQIQAFCFIVSDYGIYLQPASPKLHIIVQGHYGDRNIIFKDGHHGTPQGGSFHFCH